MPPSAFVTIPDVVLLEEGDWVAMSGGFAPTADDIRAAVEAYNDPWFWAPRGKIGWDFDKNEPDVHAPKGKAVGRFENLRVGERIGDDGKPVMQLVADHVCVPREFAKGMPSEYPNRSIEGARNATSRSTGNTYSLALTHVELLGVEGPAVRTLPDLTVEQVEAALDVAAAAPIQGPVITGGSTRVLAAVSDEHVRRAWYDEWAKTHQPDTPEDGWWIRELHLDPPELIVDVGDTRGVMLRVPYSIGADEAVSFGQGHLVQTTYTPIADVAATAAPVRGVRVFASRSDSRPANHDQEDTMDPKAIATRLGLDPETATEEEILAKLDELKGSEQGEEGGAGDGGQEPEGGEEPKEGEDGKVAASAGEPEFVKLSAGQWAGVEKKLAAFDALTEKLDREEDDRVLAAAVGKRITAAEEPAMRARLENEATREATLVLLTASVEDGGLPEIPSLGGNTVQLSAPSGAPGDAQTDLAIRNKMRAAHGRPLIKEG